MHSFLRLSVPLLILAALAGCVDPPPHCPLVKGPGCQSVTQVYTSARQADPNAGGQWVSKASQGGAVGPDWAAPAGYAEPGHVGQPIFREPRVYRVWMAPFVDAEGNMHSGQYVYFSTPGEWRYGGLQSAGAATPGLYGPLPPGESFEAKGQTTTTLTVPAGKPPAPSSASKDSTVNGITQPKETLTPQS